MVVYLAIPVLDRHLNAITWNYLAPLVFLELPDLRHPYAMVGDEAFPLQNYLLRPLPGCNLPGNHKLLF